MHHVTSSCKLLIRYVTFGDVTLYDNTLHQKLSVMLCDNGETTLCYLIWYHILSHCGILLCDILHDLSLYYGALCFSVLQFHYLYCFVRFCCAFGCVVVCFVSLYIYICIYVYVHFS